MLCESLQKRHDFFLGVDKGTCHLWSQLGPLGCPSLLPPITQLLALTFSKTPEVAGQLEGSWHTHMGELLSSTSHTLPCLQ